MSLFIARLDDRALVSITGPDAAEWLQGLVTQTVTGMSPGEARSAALLTPQGRVLFDLLVCQGPEGLVLDVDAAGRDDLVSRLSLYRLRAQVVVATAPGQVFAIWGEGDPPAHAFGDPRLAALGWRLHGTDNALPTNASVSDYARHRRALGVGEAASDGFADKAYATEANLDLLDGVDFRKGCFVGQETTSRMKRRGGVRSRIVPFRGEAEPGDELLNGQLRAGEVLAFADGVGIALVRLDRATGPLTAGSAEARLAWPDWMPQSAPETGHS